MKTKKIEVRSEAEVRKRRAQLLHAAAATHATVTTILKSSNGLAALMKLKYERVGRDPLDPSRKLHLIEQLNQTFTYLASFQAAIELFKMHPEIRSPKLNLGTEAGADIETEDSGGVIAEVFASVKPANNRKLRQDVAKVAKSHAHHKYVFFLCPGFQPGTQKSIEGFDSVTVIALDFRFPYPP
jgi:hypothetical protein